MPTYKLRIEQRLAGTLTDEVQAESTRDLGFDTGGLCVVCPEAWGWRLEAAGLEGRVACSHI